MRAGKPSALAGQVASHILDFAQKRAMKAGEHLREESLAAELGLSRSPIRRGLAVLISHGVVAKVPNHGTHLVADAATFDLSAVFVAANPTEALYTEILDSCVTGALPAEFNEADLLRRFVTSRGNLHRSSVD